MMEPRLVPHTSRAPKFAPTLWSMLAVKNERPIATIVAIVPARAEVFDRPKPFSILHRFPPDWRRFEQAEHSKWHIKRAKEVPGTGVIPIPNIGV